MPYISTFVAKRLQTTLQVPPEERDHALLRKVEKLRKAGWALEQATATLYLGQAPTGEAVAVQAGPKPSSFVEADLRKQKRLQSGR